MKFNVVIILIALILIIGCVWNIYKQINYFTVPLTSIPTTNIPVIDPSQDFHITVTSTPNTMVWPPAQAKAKVSVPQVQTKCLKFANQETICQ